MALFHPGSLTKKRSAVGWGLALLGAAWESLGHLSLVEWFYFKIPADVRALIGVPKIEGWWIGMLGVVWLVTVALWPAKEKPRLKKFWLLERSLETKRFVSVLPLRNVSARCLTSMNAFITFSEPDFLGMELLHIHLPCWFEWPKEATPSPYRYISPQETKHLIIGIYSKNGDVHSMGWQPAPPKPAGPDDFMVQQETHELLFQRLPSGEYRVKVLLTGDDFSQEFTVYIDTTGGMIRQQLSPYIRRLLRQ
jgi:hypothetical protein